MSTDNAQDLLRAADQYLLEGLKRLCEYSIAQVRASVPTLPVTEFCYHLFFKSYRFRHYRNRLLTIVFKLFSAYYSICTALVSSAIELFVVREALGFSNTC